ncbi:MAG: hypothetical protein JXC32_00315 [Anaerolineae bacterium]|nr:hypothetical protein [Anaerolineae bacterium]
MRIPRFFRRLSPIQKAVLVLCAGFALLTWMTPPMVLADDCLRDPLNAADCMRTPGYRETITVIFSGLPAIAAIAPNLFGGATGKTPPPQTGKQPQQPDEQPTTHYVVQVSSESVVVTPEQSATLAIKAWKSVNGAPWTAAPEVQIQLTLSPATPEVYVSPQQGAGEMHVEITAGEAAVAGLRMLTIVGLAPQSRTSAQVQVDVQTSPYELYISEERFEISVGETVELEVRALRQGEGGIWEDAPDARIRPWLPTEKDYFDWSPPPPYTKGANELYGLVVMRITAVSAEKPSELCYLSFTAIYPDKTEVDKRVEIVLKAPDYEIEFL